MAEIWEMSNYTANISYLINTYIYELDIQKSNINVLFTKGVIDQNTYNKLYNAPRMVRQCYIGNLQKDPAVVKLLQQGVAEARSWLVKNNNIQSYEVLSIKNDAVFVIGRCPQITDFGMIKFIVKNKYTGFYKLNHLECYYLYDSITRAETLDIKGISDERLELHKNGFYIFLLDMCNIMQCNGVEIALRMLKDYYYTYVRRMLPIDHYREFNAGSQYKYKVHTSIGTGFVIDDSTDANKELLDISYNLRLIQELSKLVNHAYFSQRRIPSYKQR